MNNELTVISFLNMKGDITLCWDETNREKMLELVKKKMDEGYSFFTTKRTGILQFKRKTKITINTLDTVENLIISDDDFDKMCLDINDSDLEMEIKQSRANFGRNKDKDFVIEKRCRNPEEVVGRNVLATRPIAGG